MGGCCVALSFRLVFLLSDSLTCFIQCPVVFLFDSAVSVNITWTFMNIPHRGFLSKTLSHL
jgi:hypothetical protein